MAFQSKRDKYGDLVDRCDALIKAGQIGSVTSLITDLNFARVPRQWRQPLAKICRRTGLIYQGLRLLHSIIRHEKELLDPATPGEICEYSVLLSRNGSIDEALELLRSVDSIKAPESLLYLGFCHISKWEYSEAARFLESYLATEADPYSKLIARVNLASSYVVRNELVQADRLLTETIALAESAGATRLVGNCLELRGHNWMLAGDHDRSREDLNRALSIFGQGQSYDQLLISKWLSIMEAFESGSPDPILRFRAEAEKRNHWESVRESDLFLVKLQFDQKTFDRVVFGTSHEAYKKRIREQVAYQPSQSYLLGHAGGMVLNLQSGEIQNADALNSGKKIHQVLAALTRDFYVPRNFGTLFSELYPGEYFNVGSSLVRLRQLLRRTRRWLEGQRIPAKIEQNSSGYRFSIHGSFGILIPADRPVVDPNSVKWLELKDCFGEAQFTVGDACSKLNLSRSSFHRLSEWALRQGALSRAGVGKATKYRVIPRAA